MAELEKLYGRVVSMTRATDGSTLTAASGISETVLQVASTGDFDDEDGGQVVVGGQVYDYVSVDEDAKTVTLASGLLAAPAEDDRVDVYDPEVEGVVVEYVALVLGDDQDPGDEPIEVTVHHGLVNMLAESIRGGAAETVTLVRDGEDDWMIWQIDGKLAVDVILEEAVTEIGVSLQDLYDRADENAAAAAEAAANGTAALTAANGKNKVTYSASGPGATPNTAGDIWFQRSGGLIAGQWEGQGGTSWAPVQLRGEVIAYLDAGQLTAGSAFVNGLAVKTNFTLGDASTNGVIQSYNFAGSSVGVYIDKFGLVAKGGSVASASITSSSITSSSFTTTGTYPISISTGNINLGGSGRNLYSDQLGVHLFGESCGLEFFVGAATVTVGGSFYIQSAGSTLAQFSSTNGIFLNRSTTVTGNVDADGTVTGNRLVTGIGTTGTAANTYMDTAGMLLKSTSSRRHKYDIETADLDAEATLNLRPTTHRRYDDPGYDEANPEAGGLYLSLIAEEAAEVSGWLATYDEDGQPDGINWPGVTLHLIETVKSLTARIEQLEAQ